jgi:hypothetical protein
MSKKSFKIARKPGQGNGSQAADTTTLPEPKSRTRKTPAAASVPVGAGVGPTTRKTIEVPEDFFFRVKMRALERKMLEKELWAEILTEYFKNHQTAYR